MSDNTPEPTEPQQTGPADSPDIDGELVPPEETAAAARTPRGASESPVTNDPFAAAEPTVAASEPVPPVGEPVVATREALPPTHEPVPAVGEPVYDLVEVAPVEASETEPVLATRNPAAVTVPEPVHEPVAAEPAPLAATSAAAMQTIYVPAPVAPRKKGNRGIGVLIAVLSTIIFAGLYALVLALTLPIFRGGNRYDFLGSVEFYIPVLFFLVGFIVLVLIVNRANWWAYVLGSLLVGLFVYFGTIATGLLIGNIFAETAEGASRLFAQALINPFVIAAGLLAREVSMWMGFVISARGRRLKVRNAEAHATYERESAVRQTEYENARYRSQNTAI